MHAGPQPAQLADLRTRILAAAERERHDAGLVASAAKGRVAKRWLWMAGGVAAAVCGTGFTVIDAEHGDRAKADVLIQGEGFSELGGRLGNLVSVRPRVEIKAVDRASGKLIVFDRQTAVAVDLAEQNAGKTALQEAAAEIARLLLARLAATAK